MARRLVARRLARLVACGEVHGEAPKRAVRLGGRVNRVAGPAFQALPFPAGGGKHRPSPATTFCRRRGGSAVLPCSARERAKPKAGSAHGAPMLLVPWPSGQDSSGGRGGGREDRHLRSDCPPRTDSFRRGCFGPCPPGLERAGAPGAGGRHRPRRCQGGRWRPPGSAQHVRFPARRLAGPHSAWLPPTSSSPQPPPRPRTRSGAGTREPSWVWMYSSVLRGRGQGRFARRS